MKILVSKSASFNIAPIMDVMDFNTLAEEPLRLISKDLGRDWFVWVNSNGISIEYTDYLLGSENYKAELRFDFLGKEFAIVVKLAHGNDADGFADADFLDQFIKDMKGLGSLEIKLDKGKKWKRAPHSNSSEAHFYSNMKPAQHKELLKDLMQKAASLARLRNL